MKAGGILKKCLVFKCHVGTVLLSSHYRLSLLVSGRLLPSRLLPDPPSNHSDDYAFSGDRTNCLVTSP